MKIIIDMHSQVLKAAYTDKPCLDEEYEIVLREYGNKDDDYYKIQKMIDSGMVVEISNMNEQPLSDEESAVLVPDSRAMLLIKEPASDQNDLARQKLYTAYIDAVATASGMLSRFIGNMHRDPNISNDIKSEISKLLQPLNKKYNDYYDKMVDFLNSKEFLAKEEDNND